jgi:hypothetical protein
MDPDDVTIEMSIMEREAYVAVERRSVERHKRDQLGLDFRDCRHECCVLNGGTCCGCCDGEVQQWQH